MNHAGEIAPLARLAHPHVAVITTIEAAHIGYLGGIEAIAEEKAAILHGLQPDGVAVLPADNRRCSRCCASAARCAMRWIVTFGADPRADARLVDVEADADFSTLRVRVDGREARLRIDAPGRHMAMNALAALAAVAALGVDRAHGGARRWTALRRSPGRGARRRLMRRTCRAGRRCCWTRATTPTAPRCARRSTCCGCSRRGAGSPFSATCWNSATPARPSMSRWPTDVVAIGRSRVHLRPADAASVRRGTGSIARRAMPRIRRRWRRSSPTQSRPGDAILVKGSLGSRMRIIVEALDAARTSIAAAQGQHSQSRDPRRG